MVKLCPALRVRSDLLSIFPYLQKCSATDGASIVWGKSRQVFARKLAGKNAKEGIFFPLSRVPLSPPLPYGNAFRALPIGARFVGKNGL
jgi:hypothetical protein